MSQRQISDYFAVEGTVRAVGEADSTAVAEQRDRRADGRGGAREQGGREWNGGRGGGRGRGRGRGGGGRGGEGGGRGGEGGRQNNDGQNGNPHHRKRPYRSPPSLNRDASSSLSQSGGDATRAVRAKVFADVYQETPKVLQVCPLGSNSSTYHPTLLHPHHALTTPPTRDNNLPSTTIRVIDGDTYTVAQQLLLDDPSRQGKLSVLNMASDRHPGGGCRTGALAQEETLCYRSTLYHSLEKEDYYPLAPYAGIYSPGVVVYRQEMRYGFAPFEDQNDWFVLGVITIAGLRRPQLARPQGPDGEEELATPPLRNMLHNKIRQILRIAVREGQEYLVLGALGCGAFRNPPGAVARAFKTVLEEPEWKGLFGGIVFAVMAGNGRQWLGGGSASGNGGGERRGNERAGGLGRGEGGCDKDGGGGTDEPQDVSMNYAGESDIVAEQGKDDTRDQASVAANGGENSPGQRNFDVFRDVLDGVIIG